MVLPLLSVAVGVALTAVLAAAAVRADALTPTGGAVAAVFGSIIVALQGFPFLLLLVLFVVGSVGATRFGFEEKRKANVHEGTHGERGVSNVLAHILLPTGLVAVATLSRSALSVPALAVLFTAALAFGAADTFASEFGVLAGRARSILTLRPVPAGTNGGVSTIGELWAMFGAVSTAVFGLALFFAFGTDLPSPGKFLLTAATAGFLGCQVDSVLGETLENRGILTKGSTNFLGMASSIALAYLALRIGGYPT